jgi:glycosyltransferase involved in cell wall biosynthesis
MRVLHIIDSLNRGGAEVMLTEMAPRFRVRNISCDVVALIQGSSPFEHKLLEQSVSLRYTGVRKLYSPLQVPSLAKLLRGYDVAHVHLFPAQLWTVLAAMRPGLKIPLITTEHCIWNTRRQWWLRPVDLWMYPHYQRIACISEATAQELIKWCPRIEGRTTIIPNGISLEIFENAQPAILANVPSNVVRLVFVGRCDAPKDHPTLLRALAVVPDAHLILVGDGPLRPRLERMAESLRIRQRVTFLGWRSDVASILKASDIYIHSTHFDGFGIAACEAMAAGLPVIASNVPGLAQVLEGAAALFPRGNYAALANHLSQLIASPELRQKMSRASIQRARQFSIEHTVNEYVQLYESVLQASRRSLAEVG